MYAKQKKKNATVTLLYKPPLKPDPFLPFFQPQTYKYLLKIKMILQEIFQSIVHHLEKKVRFIKRDWVVSTGSIFIRQDVTKTDQKLHHTVYGFGNLRFLQLA